MARDLLLLVLMVMAVGTALAGANAARWLTGHLQSTAPYDYGGMGAGLYISREIITRHGGRMWFESEAGRGSEFYFSLPLGGERVGG